MTDGDFPLALLDAVLLVQQEESSGVPPSAPVALAVNQTPVTTPPQAASVQSGQSGTTLTTLQQVPQQDRETQEQLQV